MSVLPGKTTDTIKDATREITNLELKMNNDNEFIGKE